MSRARYTEEERFRAVKLAQMVGADSAALELGLPRGTVAAWVHKYGATVANMEEATDISPVRTPGGVTVRHGKPLVPPGELVPWATMRGYIPDRISQLVWQALATVEANLAAGNVREANEAGSLADKLMSRAEVMSGGVSDRKAELTIDVDKLLELAGRARIVPTGTERRGFSKPAQVPADLPERSGESSSTAIHVPAEGIDVL